MDMRQALRPGTWSYRVKVPLLIVGISVATALAVSIAIALSAKQWLRQDLHNHATAVAQSLARGLVVHLSRDDVWEAFEAVRAIAAVEGGAQRCDVVVLDQEGRVFVSSDPARFAVQAGPEVLSQALRQASTLAVARDSPGVADVTHAGDAFSVVKMLLRSVDGEGIGVLLISYSHAVFAQRYTETIATLVAITLGLAFVLLPLGWWLGHRLARPVARVTDTLYKLGEDAARKSANYAHSLCGADTIDPPPHSEIARLEHSLAQLEQQLKEKEVLQAQFVAADRLAAIGRLTSGVAHEINNPLAGMLNALSNLRREPALLAKTTALLERGLEQIRQTLSALLIETQTTARALSPPDVEDLRVLVLPQAARKQLRLDWTYRIESDIDVPAAPVRQVLLNLLLNAVHAADGWIAFEATLAGDRLVLRVSNDGRELPASRRGRLFEPLVGDDGHGLGLWASHQLVASMGGQIHVSSDDGQTLFEVRLPLQALPQPRATTRQPAEIAP